MLTGGDDVLAPGYETGMGKRASRETADWRKYRLDTVDGDRVITLYDNALGEEDLMHFSIISAKSSSNFSSSFNPSIATLSSKSVGLLVTSI